MQRISWELLSWSCVCEFTRACCPCPAAGVQAARLMGWQERLSVLQQLSLWEHALYLGLVILQTSQIAAAAAAAAAHRQAVGVQIVPGQGGAASGAHWTFAFHFCSSCCPPRRFGKPVPEPLHCNSCLVPFRCSPKQTDSCLWWLQILLLGLLCHLGGAQASM